MIKTTETTWCWKNSAVLHYFTVENYRLFNVTEPLSFK